jgi:hypothetical protein
MTGKDYRKMKGVLGVAAAALLFIASIIHSAFADSMRHDSAHSSRKVDGGEFPISCGYFPRAGRAM